MAKAAENTQGIAKVLAVNTSAELLSYIINQDPVLKENIDLPVQGQDIRPIGQIIMSNVRYKNAFLNICNVIGLTIIDRNYWENPWENFANRGRLPYGQTVREIINDLADVFDYNEYVNNATHFLENVVPNVYEYMHELNYQKFYKTTTSDEQMAMAFVGEQGLFDFIEAIISSLYEAYKYDKYIVDKYQLCRRIVDGTVTAVEIPDYEGKTPRERVAFMKNISNKMSFRSPNYNPAGIRKASSFDRQILIMNTDFEADMSTDVLATSYFRNEAEFKTRMALIDDFSNHDEARLKVLLKEAFIPFTEAELGTLKRVPAMIVDEDFFQDYYYTLSVDEEGTSSGATKKTDFYNPETLRRNHWLHVWYVISTSPFANAVVFTQDTPSVESVTINPAESSVSAGQNIQLSATVTTNGFANKAVTWEITKKPATGDVKVDANGKVSISSNTPSGTANIEVTATSVYDNTKEGKATITVL